MDLVEVLVQGMKLETDGRAFYTQLAEQVQDAETKQVFQQLAQDEVDHYNYIERQYNALQQGQGWAKIPELDAVEVIDAVSLVFPPGKKGLEMLPENPTEEDALLFALGIEDKSFKLYYNSAQQVSDDAAKQMFLQLASAEHKHFEILMQRYESFFSYPR